MGIIVGDRNRIFMNDWNIQSRAHGCQACGKAFADKQPYHTLLHDRRQVFERLDICPECWQAQHVEGAAERKGFVSHWQGVYEAPPPPAPEAIKKENAESLLRKLMERGDPRFSAASYILAVMLERKRLLKIKEQIFNEGRRVFVYEHPKSGDIFTIPDPNLQLNQLEQVQHDVSQLLEHGLPDPDAPVPVAVDPVSATELATEGEPAVAPTAEESPIAGVENPESAAH
jgi:hypothetical protein